jgi:hypothetical protein
MNADEIRRRLAEAELAGYRFSTRFHEAHGHEPADWMVVIQTPDGETLYPTAIDDVETAALERAAVRVTEHLAAQPVVVTAPTATNSATASGE